MKRPKITKRGNMTTPNEELNAALADGEIHSRTHNFLTNLHNKLLELENKFSGEGLKEEVESIIENAVAGIKKEFGSIIQTLNKRVQQLEGRGSSKQMTPQPTEQPSNLQTTTAPPLNPSRAESDAEAGRDQTHTPGQA